MRSYRQEYVPPQDHPVAGHISGYAKLTTMRDGRVTSTRTHNVDSEREAWEWMREEIRYIDAQAQRNIEHDRQARRMQQHRDQSFGRCHNCHGVGSIPSGADDPRDGPLSLTCRSCNGTGKATCITCDEQRTEHLQYRGVSPMCVKCSAEDLAEMEWKERGMNEPMEEPPDYDPREEER